MLQQVYGTPDKITTLVLSKKNIDEHQNGVQSVLKI